MIVFNMMEEEINIDDIILNLKMISKIKQNDKMVVINGIISVDIRVLKPLRRWYTADNREDTINFISNIINNALKIATEKNNSTNNNGYYNESIKNELLSAIQGLDHLSATYKIDNLMIAKIDILKEKINKACNSTCSHAPLPS